MAKLYPAATAVGQDRTSTVESQLVKQSIKILAWIVLTGLCAGACADTQFLKVHYQLPAKSDTSEDIRVHLSFKDMRSNKAILSEAARKELSDFSGYFTLVVGPTDSNGTLLGAYDLESLIIEIFKQRLQHSGVQVAEEKDSNVQMTVRLKEFRLDLKSRKWLFNMSYQLDLTRNGKLMASDKTGGNAERSQTIGARDANKIISELLTDMINRLDIAALLQNAGL